MALCLYMLTLGSRYLYGSDGNRSGTQNDAQFLINKQEIHNVLLYDSNCLLPNDI